MTGTGPLGADYRELRHGAGAVGTERDVLLVAGADAAGFLQGQLSCDVDALVPGEVSPSLLLRPDGKLHSVLRLHRLGPERFACDMAPGLGEAALARLERFKLRVAVEMEVRPQAMLSLRGAAAVAPEVPPVGEPDGEVLRAVIPADWAGVAGWDVVAPVVPPVAGARPCRPEALEALRIEAGVPAWGRELTEGLIAAEAGIVAGHVSFTKGCYVGQELVARIESRGGNVPRHLRGVLLEGDAPATAGTTLTDDTGSAVGRITSSALSPHFGCAVALAYVHRRVEPPAVARLDTEGGRRCEIRPLPLVP